MTTRPGSAGVILWVLVGCMAWAFGLLWAAG